MKTSASVSEELRWVRWILLMILGVLLLLLSYQNPSIANSALGQVVSLLALYAGLAILAAAALVLLGNFVRLMFRTENSEGSPGGAAAEKSE